ncbi:thermonuclease family protein [Microcoleus sp. PH2017_26_ELK_O_A]|uniref:thermonuclease family protein n=2 Tax=unclassified Microcoleus TaxID=2642155 RepID=UPI001E15C39C|nr:thermonuclease family protein [Microcoleus sp. PH2017_26_ELK_O_A]MCC3600099.1 thermonuclease family protein [Microcoleus sp. PH2017_26_ELK_O_A]
MKLLIDRGIKTSFLMVVLCLTVVVSVARSQPRAPINQAIDARVISVGDGDTLNVRNASGQSVTVRLACIDAPERNQPGGQESARRLSELLSRGTAVKVVAVDKDRYGRTVGVVFRGRNINQQLVQEGQAWVYEEYLNNCPSSASDLRQAQNAARQQGRGLWAQANPCAPWDYRKGQCAPASPPAQQAGCDSSYPDVCIPPAPPDLNCGDVPHRRFRVVGPDPHGFDRDKDGIGCER